jgi:hypothetical protein
MISKKDDTRIAEKGVIAGTGRNVREVIADC